MKTTIQGLLLCFALLPFLSAHASVGLDSLGQVYQAQAIAAIDEQDRDCFFAMLENAGAAFQSTDDLEGWLKLYKEAGKALRQSDWADAVQQSVQVMQQGLKKDFGRSPDTPEKWDALIWLHVNLGYMHLHYRDDYQNALVQYETASRLFQRHFEEEDYYTVNYIYRPLANLYSRFGDFQTAIGLLRTAYRFFKDTGRTAAQAKVLNDLAIAEELAGEPDAALGHIEAALNLENLSAKDLVLLHSARARVLGVLGRHEAALHAIDAAFAHLPKVEQVPPAYLREWEGSLWNVRGSINAALQRWAASAQDFAEGEAILRTSGEVSYRRSLGKLLVDKGEMLRQKGAYQTAAACHQSAMVALLPGYRFNHWQELPALELLYAENTFSEALTGWANSLWAWYEQEGGQEKLEPVLQACKLIFEVEQMLRRRYQGESAKLSSVQGIRARTELGVRAALELWAQTRQPGYKEAALELPEQLIIVPGGVLGLLPFDALLTEPAGHCNFSAMPYLINRYEISYAYAATFQRTVQQRAVKGKGLAAFAPDFDGRGGFGALAYNQPQAAAAASLFRGQAFLGPDATRAQLQAVAGEAGVLHFSTHAQANTETGNFSFIVFADGKGGYDSLFVKDIYLLPLQAEMVVLNGCETFVGQWYDGEGVINLARSFLAAGANSVISSLWSINDDESSHVMETFYTSLSAGQARSAALRSAKLEQVASGGKLGAHPVYWAAFHAVGKPGKLPAAGGGSRLLLWSVVISGLLLGVVYWRFQL